MVSSARRSDDLKDEAADNRLQVNRTANHSICGSSRESGRNSESSGRQILAPGAASRRTLGRINSLRWVYQGITSTQCTFGSRSSGRGSPDFRINQSRSPTAPLPRRRPVTLPPFSTFHPRTRRAEERRERERLKGMRRTKGRKVRGEAKNEGALFYCRLNKWRLLYLPGASPSARSLPTCLLTTN